MKINWKAVREFVIPPTLFESEGYARIESWIRENFGHKTAYADRDRAAWWSDRFPIVLIEEREYRNTYVHLRGEGWSLTYNPAYYGTAWKLNGDRRRMEEDTMQMMFSI